MIGTERTPATQNHLDSDSQLSRRRFLKMGTLLAAGLVFPQSILAVPRPDDYNERLLKFFNTHTRESLEVCYRRKDRYNKQAIRSVNNILRDHRTNEVFPIDLRLLDLLHAIRVKAGRNSCLHIISGYRSPTTNARLRRSGRGVARKSLHMRGHAADIRIPGVPTSTVRKIALDLGVGGVGYYPRPDFVHVDIGPVRAW